MRQIAVIGLGVFGSTVAKSLANKGVEVIAIDSNKEKVEMIKNYVAVAVALDSTDEKALRAVGLEEVDVAVVCIGESVEAGLLTTALLKKIGVRKIFARAMTKLQEGILKTMEVDDILIPEEEMGEMLANSLVTTNIEKHIPLATGHSMVEMAIPKSLAGKTILQIDARKKFGVNIVAVKKKVPEITDSGERTFKEVINDVPSPDDRLEENDVLIVVGMDKNIKEFSSQ
jgi:trk system potassium uptake protein TrkA